MKKFKNPKVKFDNEKGEVTAMSEEEKEGAYTSLYVLTTDSGPMHVGVAMNVPVVTMFGASPVPGFYPYDARSVLIKAPVDCHPCGIHECPHQGEENLACMKQIKPAIVMKYVDELLDKYQGRPAYKLPRHYGEYQCRIVEA